MLHSGLCGLFSLAIIRMFVNFSYLMPARLKRLYCRYWKDLVGSNMLVYPMQAVTSVFTLNVPKNRVMDSWIVESGVLNGPNSFVGSFTVSPLTDRTLHPLT